MIISLFKISILPFFVSISSEILSSFNTRDKIALIMIYTRKLVMKLIIVENLKDIRKNNKVF